MAASLEEDQQTLCQLWKRPRKDGCLSPWQQAKVFGLMEAWLEMHGDKNYGRAKWIAERVVAQGNESGHASHEAVRRLVEKMDGGRRLVSGQGLRLPGWAACTDPSCE